MSHPHVRPRLPALAALLGLLALGAGGCFNPFRPLIAAERGLSSPPPAPNTPSNCIRLFEWCWQNRSEHEYRTVFTDDYRFLFAQGDSAGNTYRQQPWRREDEMAMATNMFTGSIGRTPARSITLSLDRTLVTFPDPRPGMNPIWHKTIRTSVSLQVQTGDEQSYEVTGFASFFLVRGDSAAIPNELTQQGFVRDSTRWWIEEWDDETVTIGPGGTGSARPAGGPAAVRPAGAADLAPIPMSWGRVKAIWR
ncbi:MAG TPA: hypothetical protein VGU27_12690 [Candidatus Eisenbacteria bacterium]|nr:hypothetical protein [Candidatus Eisenbacteria bacterium]